MLLEIKNAITELLYLGETAMAGSSMADARRWAAGGRPVQASRRVTR
ncbi:MAG: hypothetical protein ACRDNG_02700 [Gaiellaceae bacterium]